MLKIAILILLLTAFSSGAAAGEVFSCRDAQGNLVFSDDPSNFPPGCRPVGPEKVSKKEGGLTIIPSPPTPRAEPSKVLKEKAEEAQRKKDRVAKWKEKALKLAGDFRQASAERVPTLPAPQVQRALEKMTHLEREAAELRKEVFAAGIPAADRAEIEHLLAPIPPPP